MQKLEGEFKNAPADVKSLLVLSPASLQLNRDESLSAVSKVLTSNNPEGVQPVATIAPGPKAKVFVKSIEGLPLMPCGTVKAKHLLKAEICVQMMIFRKNLKQHLKVWGCFMKEN